MTGVPFVGIPTPKRVFDTYWTYWASILTPTLSTSEAQQVWHANIRRRVKLRNIKLKDGGTA